MYPPGCVALMPQSGNQHDVHRNPDDIRLHFFPPLSNMLGSQFKFYYGCNIMLFKEAAFSRMEAVIQHLDRVKPVNPSRPWEYHLLGSSHQLLGAPGCPSPAHRLLCGLGTEFHQGSLVACFYCLMHCHYKSSCVEPEWLDNSKPWGTLFRFLDVSRSPGESPCQSHC